MDMQMEQQFRQNEGCQQACFDCPYGYSLLSNKLWYNLHVQTWHNPFAVC